MTTQAVVTTAVSLSDAQRKQLQTGLEKKFGPVALREVIDEKVIGGIKVTVQSERYDATVATKLSLLHQELK